jgi:hypothetical protein
MSHRGPPGPRNGLFSLVTAYHRGNFLVFWEVCTVRNSNPVQKSNSWVRRETSPLCTRLVCPPAHPLARPTRFCAFRATRGPFELCGWTEADLISIRTFLRGSAYTLASDGMVSMGSRRHWEKSFTMLKTNSGDSVVLTLVIVISVAWRPDLRLRSHWYLVCRSIQTQLRVSARKQRILTFCGPSGRCLSLSSLEFRRLVCERLFLTLGPTGAQGPPLFRCADRAARRGSGSGSG